MIATFAVLLGSLGSLRENVGETVRINRFSRYDHVDRFPKPGDLAALGFKMPKELLLDLFARDPGLAIDVILGEDLIRGLEVNLYVLERKSRIERAVEKVEELCYFRRPLKYRRQPKRGEIGKFQRPAIGEKRAGLMAEFQEELGFPPAPKLDVFGKLDPSKAIPAEMRGQEIFFGKGQCGACHAAPCYTDNLMHDLKTERFFKPEMINGLIEVGDGAVKTFPPRGIKDSPPYLHDGRLLTLDDTVEFFNLVLGTKLTGEEKHDLVAFLRTL
jgi:hypothetical protein